MLSLLTTAVLLISVLVLARLLFDSRVLNNYRWQAQLLAIVLSLVLATWCSQTKFVGTSTSIVFGSAIAVVPFLVVGLWTVAYREMTTLRMGVFLGLLVMLGWLMSEPVTNTVTPNSGTAFGFGSLQGFDRLRLIVGSCGGLIAGVYCRLLGWRIQARNPDDQRADAATTDLWVLIMGIALSVPLLLFAQSLAYRSFDRIFDSNFAMLRMSCFYAACALAFLSIMVCRFSNQWLTASVLIIAGLAAQFYWQDDLFMRLGFLLRPLDWYYVTPVFLLTWWFVTLVLRESNVALKRTGELLLFQFQIKHFIVTTGLACFLLSSVRTQYVEQFGAMLKQDIQAVSGDVKLRGTDIVAITVRNDGVPDLLLKALPRLNQLESFKIASSTVTQELITALTKAPKLRSLEFEQCAIVMNKPIDYSGFEHLDRLVLNTSGLSKSEFKQLTNGSSIQKISLDDPSLLTHLSESTSNSLEQLDLQRIPTSPLTGFAIDQLLKMDAPRLKSINRSSPMFYGLFKSGIHPELMFTIVPTKFPQLQELQLRCNELTPFVVEELNQLALGRLELWDCFRGFDQLKNLKVDRIKVIGQFEDIALEQLLNEPKVTEVTGLVRKELIQASLSTIERQNRKRGLAVDLSEHVRGNLSLKRRFQRYSKSSYRRVLRIDSGKQNVEAKGLRMDLDQFTRLCENASSFQVGSVHEGGKLLFYDLSFNEYSASRVAVLKNLSDQSWERIKPFVRANVLVFEDSQLAPKTWRSISRWSAKIRIYWNELPKNFEKVVEALADRDIYFSLPRNLTRAELSVFQRDPKHRLGVYDLVAE